MNRYLSHYEELIKPDLSIEPNYLHSFSKKILTHFKDKFNHITIVNYDFNSSNREYKYGGLSIDVKNHVKGIGKKIYDNSKLFGSNSTLKSIIHLPRISNFYVYYHEFLHQYSNYLIPTIKRSHYGFSTGGVLGGFSNETLEQLSENRYKASYKNLRSFGIGGNRSYTYSFLDLYLMGLAPKNELPTTIKVGKCDKYISTNIGDDCPYWINKSKGIFYANSIQDITIDELIKKYGEREPNYKNSPKVFRGIVILVSPINISSKDLNEMNKKVEEIMETFQKNTLYRAKLKLDDLFEVEK